MLDFLRKQAQSTVIQVTILAIILVFIFWGVGGKSGNGPNSLATVNGQMVSYQEYQRLYDQKLNQLRTQLGGEIPSGLLEKLGFKKQVLNELIQKMLLSQGAEAAGLKVSAEEVRQAIQEMPAFQKDGVFNVEWYNQVLAGNRMKATEFEASVKDDLLTAKILGHLSRFGGISEAELRERFNQDYRQKKFSYVTFEAADFEKNVKVTDAELSAYFESHRGNYLPQPEINLSYVLFPFDQAGGSPVTDEDVKAYYEQHQGNFTVPETRRARHILIKAAEDAPAAEVEQARKRAEELLQKAKDGGNFAELARRYSEDKGSAANGGDLGYFGRGQMVPAFEEAVFGLGKGGLTMVRSRFGFHVIKLEDIRPGRVKPLAEVKAEISAKLGKERARNTAFKEASEAYEKIILSGSLAKYAEGNGGVIEETGLFRRDQPPSVLKDEPAFLKAALALKQGELSSIIDGGSAYAVFFAKEIKEPQPPELAQVRKRVEEDFIKERSVELAREAAAKMLTELKSGGSLAEKAMGSGGVIQESPFISRVDKAGSRLDPVLLDTGLALTATKPVADQVEKVGRTFYVLVFQSEKEPQEGLFKQKHDELAAKLAEENRTDLIAAWVANLRSRAEIVINPSFSS